MTLSPFGPGGRLSGVGLRRRPGVIPPGPGDVIGSIVALDSGPTSFAQQFPEGGVPAGSGVLVGGEPTQIDILSSWPDGSVRNAILSVADLEAGTHDLAIGTNATGTFTPTVPTAAVAISMRWPFQRLGTSYSVGEGETLAVRLDQSAGGVVVADTIFLRRASTGERLVRTFRDGAGNYAESGTWTASTHRGWREPIATTSSTYSVRQAAAGTGGSATWTFADLAADDYEVYAIWQPATSGRSPSAGYAILVDDVEAGTATVDQTADPTWDFVQTPNPDDSTYVATLPGGVGSDLWRDGPICREWRRFEVPFLRASDSEPHEWLTATFDVRCFSGGQAEVEVTVDHSLNKANATTQIYLATLAIGGVEVVTAERAGALHRETGNRTVVGHGWCEQWRRLMGVSGFARNRVWNDYELQVAAEALPRWKSNTSTSATADPATNPRWQGLYPIAEWATNPPNRDLDGPGGSGHRGSYPKSHVRARLGDDDTGHDVLILGGRAWSNHAYRCRELPDDPNYSGLGPWRIVDPAGEKPQFRVLESDQGPADPLGIVRPRTLLSLNFTGGASTAHQPLPQLVPWLISGDRAFADDLGAQAAFCVSASLRDEPDSLFNSRRMLTGDYSDGTVAGTQVRDGGWMLRTLVEAGAWLPDADPIKSWSQARVDNTLEAMDLLHAAHPMPIGPIRSYVEAVTTVGDTRYYATQTLYLSFCVWALWRAIRLGCPHGSDALDAITRWFAMAWYGDSPEKQCGDVENPWEWPSDYKAVAVSRPRVMTGPSDESRGSLANTPVSSAQQTYALAVLLDIVPDGPPSSTYPTTAFGAQLAFGVGVTMFGRPWEDAYAAAVASAGSILTTDEVTFNLDFGL